MKPTSLMRKIEAFFTVRPDEELTMPDVEAKFSCTFDQAVRAVRKLRMEGMELRFRFGRVPVLRIAEKKSARGVPIRKQNARRVPIVVNVANSPFQGHAETVRIPGGPAVHMPRVVERRDGVTRVVHVAVSETAEWQAAEAARRAKQRPPEPTKGARTRGKKVRAWDGEEA